MENLSKIFSILLITWFLLFDQQIVVKTVGYGIAYDDEVFVTTTDYTTYSETISDTDENYKGVVVIPNETPMENENDKTESSLDDIIELNVGGQRITTYRSTLTAVPNSKLALLFTETQQNKIHFFDYNPLQFEYLLDQLRSIKRMPKTPAYELNIVAPNVDIHFNFTTMLFELGLNPDRFLSPLVGTHLRLSVDSLIGWKECFRGKYNTPFDGKILTNTCKGKRLLVACRSINDKKTLIVAGVGKREDIFYPCSLNAYCTTRMRDGTGFYYAQDHAWGFEGRPKDFIVNSNVFNGQFYYNGIQQNPVFLNPCDSSDQHSEYRLCWSLRSNIGRGGGDRCGSSKNIHNTKGWERLIYQAV